MGPDRLPISALRWLDWIFWGGIPSSLSKDMGKRLPQLYHIKIKFRMIWVLLQSESPWQCNDAITFFIYLSVSLSQEFFLRNRFREFVHAIIASIMAKFEQIL